MLTVSKLARGCGLSRSTVLYYESIGLLKTGTRTSGNYRNYGACEVERLRQICLYRAAGLTLTDIRELLDKPAGNASSVLKRRLGEIQEAIEKLKAHQQSILKLLRASTSFDRTRNMNKEKWVSIMKDSGFTETDLHRWHMEFEKSAPDDHQEFLEFLRIPTDEIQAIRNWSRKPA